MRAAFVASLLTVAALGGPARAAVGVLPTVVEGFPPERIDGQRQQLDRNVKEALAQSYVALEFKPGCGSEAKCIEAAVASSTADIDEVTQIVLRAVGPNLAEMELRIFGRDGERQQVLIKQIADAEAVDATTAMLRKAFDPAGYRGTVEIKGVPEGAELLVDGLPLEEPRAQLRVGKHVLEIGHADGSVESVSFDVAFERNTEVLVPSSLRPATASAGPPFWVATGTAASGILAVGGGLVLAFIANENKTEWARRAEGKTFPRNVDDPVCTADDSCVGPNQEQLGWTRGYGPLTSGQVGQGARFMMVAFSRDNEERWESSTWAGIGLVVAGALATVGGVVAVVTLFPGEGE